MIKYGFTKTVAISFPDAVSKVTQELKKNGFGILSSIDIQKKFKDMLGADFDKYMILGVCHPPSAYQAVLAEENIGLMLPCNVILFEKDGKTVISIVKPTVLMEMIDNRELKGIAESIEGKLETVINAFAEDRC